MVDDTVALLELLRDRFGRKPFVAGFSFGATFAAQAAVLRPDLVAALVATGMDIDVPLAEQHIYDFALRTARQRGNRRAVRQLEKHRPAPAPGREAVHHPGPLGRELRRRHRRATWNSLARTLLASLLRSPDYSPAAAVRTVRGVTASQAALLPAARQHRPGRHHARASTCRSSWSRAAWTRSPPARPPSVSTTR